MAQLINRLSAKFVENIKEAGRYPDGRGLILDATGGGKRWIFRYRFAGRQREMGLGSARSVSLAKARDLAAGAREQVAMGIDPISARDAARLAADEAAKDATSACPTFGECADEFMRGMSPGWRNAKHAAQWKMTLTEYAKPLRPLPVDSIETADVLAVLRPIWTSKPETASRLRGRIERVLDYAKVHGLRSGENPARWRGHLSVILPPAKKLSRGHHAALPYPAIGTFMRKLRSRDAVAARALEFAILTAARSNEVLRARWSEIDFERRIWTVPGARMKSGREHRVPLSPAAIAVLEAVKPISRGMYVFPRQSPGSNADEPLSSMAFGMLLRRLGVENVTAHGFRSTFRDWAAEETPVANIVAEAALAHVVRDKAEAAYRRGDLFEKRRNLMELWASYCDQPSRIAEIPQDEVA